MSHIDTYRSLVANKMGIEKELSATSAELSELIRSNGSGHEINRLHSRKAELKNNLQEVQRLMMEIKPQVKEMKMRDFGNLFKTHKNGLLPINTGTDDRYEALVCEISSLATRYQKFSGDPSRVNSMRLLAARFAQDLSVAMKKAGVA